MPTPRGRRAAEPPDPTELQDIPADEREEAERELEPFFDDCHEPVSRHEREAIEATTPEPRAGVRATPI